MHVQIEGMQHVGCSYLNLNLCIYGRGLNAVLAVLIQKLKYYSHKIFRYVTKVSAGYFFAYHAVFLT